MEKLLYIICVLIIILVLLQSGKASDSSQIITGGNSILMGKSKERGFEKFITRFTYFLGIAFIVLCIILSV